MTITVLIADDQTIVRAGLRVLVDRDPELTVVGEAATGDEAVVLARESRPDVILMDIRMPGLDGIRATGILLDDPATAGCRIIMLTTFDSDEHVFDALRAGASGFLLKDTNPAELRRAIHVVADGEALLAPSVTRRLIGAYARQTVVPSTIGVKLAGLTDRETEVLGLVARGMSNGDIATRLSISPMTAKTHVRRLMAKLDAHDRAQLVVAAYEAGITKPGG
ncbi:MAG TPA: response regulator transcription factor [Pseudonocardiaceae bacterium]|nr:response regulator transcription factor [Pseudonocardiaceae bacterium]